MEIQSSIEKDINFFSTFFYFDTQFGELNQGKLDQGNIFLSENRDNKGLKDEVERVSSILRLFIQFNEAENREEMANYLDSILDRLNIRPERKEKFKEKLQKLGNAVKGNDKREKFIEQILYLIIRNIQVREVRIFSDKNPVIDREKVKSKYLEFLKDDREIYFLSYAYSDRMYTYLLFLYFYINGVFLIIDWMINPANSCGITLKRELKYLIMSSTGFIFLRSPDSELRISSVLQVRQWCSWEMGVNRTKCCIDLLCCSYWKECCRCYRKRTLEEVQFINRNIRNSCCSRRSQFILKYALFSDIRENIFLDDFKKLRNISSLK